MLDEGTSRRIEIEVADTGIGIAPDDAARLFEPFTQADESTTRHFGGTGLGLAISRSLTELMGGKISVHSEGLGHGSTFTFSVILEALDEPSGSVIADEQQGLDGMRMLVVDDNYTNRRILEVKAAQWGVEAVAASSGEEALSIVDSGNRFDVAVIDMHMPEMDGVDLAKGLHSRFDDGVEAFPLALLSSGMVLSSSDRSLFNAALMKPTRSWRLHGVLAKLAGGKRPTAGGHSTGDSSRDELTTVPNPASTPPPLRILMAEDNVVNQKVGSAMLSKLGYEISIVSDGAQAVDRLMDEAFDVVLMDMHMPELDGVQATRQIRAMTHIRQPWIVALTANAQQADRDACFTAGMDDYLSKPVRSEELSDALARAHAAVTTEGAEQQAA